MLSKLSVPTPRREWRSREPRETLPTSWGFSEPLLLLRQEKGGWWFWPGPPSHRVHTIGGLVIWVLLLHRWQLSLPN